MLTQMDTTVFKMRTTNMNYEITYEKYKKLSPLGRLKFWVDMPLDKVKEYYEFPDILKEEESFTSEHDEIINDKQEQDYENYKY